MYHENLLSVMECIWNLPFPIMWFMEYVPWYLRFTIAVCILGKLLKDVYQRRNHVPGVLKHSRAQTSLNVKEEFYTNYHNNCLGDCNPEINCSVYDSRNLY